MPESYSINDLFTKGLTREQFIKKYNEIKASGEAPESSVFEDGMEQVAGQMFDTLDSLGNKKTSGNGILDENEIEKLMALGGKDDKKALSEADLEAFYGKVMDTILSKYSSKASPEELYNDAVKKAGGDIRYSNYLEELDDDINTIVGLINSRRTNSSLKVSDLQNQINDLLENANKLDIDTAKKYKKETDKLNALRREDAENKAKIAKTENEIKDRNNTIELIKREIEALDPKKDADEIKTKQEEISAHNSWIDGLNKKLKEYNQKDSKLKQDIAKSNRVLIDIRTNALTKNDRIKSKIGQLQAKIVQEQETSKKAIEGYEQRLQQLQNAKTYSYKKIPVTPSNEIMTSHNNDNKMTFAELQAQGLKYSASKGQRLAQDVGSHATGFIGRCSNRVANGLQRTGLGNERMPSAHMMDDAFRRDIASGKNRNFREIKVNSLQDLKNLPAGCIVVYEANAAWDNGFKKGHYNAKHGHIEVTLGNGTAASDGITRNMRYSDRMSVFVPVENA